MNLPRTTAVFGGIFVLCLACTYTFTRGQQQSVTGEPAALPIGPERFRADIHSVERSLPNISDRGAANYFLAWLHAHLNEWQQALALLKQCPAAEGFDPGGVDDFHGLEANPEFRALVK